MKNKKAAASSGILLGGVAPIRRSAKIPRADQKPPIPPLSKIRLARYDATRPSLRHQVGEIFLVTGYSANDGLNCIFLSNKGAPDETWSTTDPASLKRYYEIVSLGDPNARPYPDEYYQEREAKRAKRRRGGGPS